MRPFNSITALGITSFTCLLLSLYMLRSHYDERPSFCDLSDHFSCSILNHSQYSMLFGVPIAFLGLLWSSTLFYLVFKMPSSDPKASSILFDGDIDDFPVSVYLLNILAWCGVVFVIYLIGVELYAGMLCFICTAVHILCVAILYLVLQLKKSTRSLTLKIVILRARSMLITLFFVVLTAYLLMLVISQVSKNRGLPNAPVSESDGAQLALCLTSHSVSMFGKTTCGACQKQKSIFGDAFRFIHFVDCTHPSAHCREYGVDAYPTWIDMTNTTMRAKGIHDFEKMKLKFPYCNNATSISISSE